MSLYFIFSIRLTEGSGEDHELEDTNYRVVLEVQKIFSWNKYFPS